MTKEAMQLDISARALYLPLLVFCREGLQARPMCARSGICWLSHIPASTPLDILDGKTLEACRK